MRRVYRAILVPHRVLVKEKKWELLFTCFDASDIDDRLKELWLTRSDVIRCRY
jgi:hypothetical protein